jgi:hypothetical protein
MERQWVFPRLLSAHAEDFSLDKVDFNTHKGKVRRVYEAHAPNSTITLSNPTITLTKLITIALSNLAITLSNVTITVQPYHHSAQQHHHSVRPHHHSVHHHQYKFTITLPNITILCRLGLGVVHSPK